MVLILRFLPLTLAWVGLRSTHVFGIDPISFDSRTAKVYDSKPKLRIKGLGFSQLSAEDLQGFKFDPPMAVGGGVLQGATVESDGVILLELARGGRWVGSGGSLLLTEAYVNGEQVLPNSITVATIVPTPTVFPSNDLAYLTVTPHVMINGANFDEKNSVLYFSPPLVDGTDVTIFVKSPTTILVSLIPKGEGNKWAEEPGPLKLVAIDTGAGRLLLREDLGGVTIAEMQVDMEGHSITVEGHEEVHMYQSSKFLTIAGRNFNPSNTKFRFGIDLFEGMNYTALVTTMSATLTLKEGSKWHKNSASLPDPLVLLAADAGDGYVALGSTFVKAGLKVATIYEDPAVYPSHQEIGRTLTHELFIRGTGFTKVFPPIIAFEPPLEREDYAVQVMNRTMIKVSLAGTGHGWMSAGETGELSVSAINTGGGMFNFEKAVPVAMVVSDNDPHESGIQIKPDYVTQLYQSSKKALVIEGSGFPLDDNMPPHLVFGFGGPTEGSFSCVTLSENELEATLLDGFEWAKQGGPLFLLKAKFGEAGASSKYEVDYSSPGLKVASVLDDPLVTGSQLHVYASHTRHITIHGSGFLSAFNPHTKPQVVLSPTELGNYVVKDNDWSDTAMTISLVADSAAKWADVSSDGETVDVKVVSIDTGGGAVAMPGGGIAIALVRMDDSTFSCDDSCVYAIDGQCDEDQDGLLGMGWYGSRSDSNAEMESYTSRTNVGRGNAGSYTGAEDSEDLALNNAASCPMGTDCTDCGLQMVEDGKCTNSCKYARDGACDDRRSSGVCPDGTDCQDCGPWGAANFTEAVNYDSSISHYVGNDDDGSFLAKDPNNPIFAGQRANAIGRYKRIFVKHEVVRKESERAEGVFLETLWAAIILVGCSVTFYLTVLIVRCARGEKIDLPIPTNPDVDRPRR